ncbi:MAG TPA: hypothetical protein VGQ46_21020 [Thermoanaerobaculia bacterium]|jgi:hypothetical protein|nr:hypothetical protein [Thermoanaerobaculia bacterium]
MADDKSYLPDDNAVVETIDVAASAAAELNEAGAEPFTILRTLELDPYETAGPQNVAEAAELAAAASDEFTGHDRKAAKISIASAPVTAFNDLAALLASLPPDATMAHHNPPIGTQETSDRVAEEKKNVGVKVWLYAASREKDNDFHTIIGSDPAETPRIFMNAEVSGLPPAGSSARATLQAVRSSFASIVQHKPLAGYDFYNPPRPITVEGSLFFDVTHAHGGSTPGPPQTKPHTIWEIHPITSMKPRVP